MQNYINSLRGSTVYVDVVTRYAKSGVAYSGTTANSADVASYALPENVPYLAQGAVIPPNAPFMAVLGDQRNGTNVEAPLTTIQEALRNVMADQSDRPIEINFTGDLAQLARILYPEIHRQDKATARSRGW